MNGNNNNHTDPGGDAFFTVNAEEIYPGRHYHAIPRVLVIALAVAAGFSLLFIYAMGKEALSSASDSEKEALSVVMSEAEDESEETSYNAVYSTIWDAMNEDVVMISSDGVQLTGIDEETGMETVTSAAFYNLLGTSSSVETRYLADIYGDTSITYNPLTGIRRYGEKDSIALTLNCEAQEEMYSYLCQHGVVGFVTVYDYLTGGILLCVSCPGASSSEDIEDLEEGSLVSRALYSTGSGSTMKIITLLLFAEQGIDVDSISYTCSGSYTLADGSSITCSGSHGEVGIAAAVGYSCNAFFAHVIENYLDMDRAIETLKELGFEVNGEETDVGVTIGEVPVSSGSITLEPENGWDFDNTFCFIGETRIAVNTWMLLQLAAACAAEEDEVVCSPVFLQEETGSASSLFDSFGDELALVRDIWQEGCELVAANYPDLSSSCLFLKSGTFETDDAGSVQKNIVAASQSLHLAVWVTAENYRVVSDDSVTTLDVTPAVIAAEALEIVQSVR